MIAKIDRSINLTKSIASSYSALSRISY